MHNIMPCGPRRVHSINSEPGNSPRIEERAYPRATKCGWHCFRNNSNKLPTRSSNECDGHKLILRKRITSGVFRSWTGRWRERILLLNRWRMGFWSWRETEFMIYFSEREEGESPRENEKIDEGAWGGFQALVHSLIEDGSFGASYPTACEDGAGPVGSNDDAVWKAMRADIPNLQVNPRYGISEDTPQTLDILDMIEFCWRCIGEPIRKSYHEFFRHHHLDFDRKAGQDKFQSNVNRIFRRNGLAYELTEHGQIERLAPPVLREELVPTQFHTADDELNGMLEKARYKFLSPDAAIRSEALEALWDAWERLKTLGNGLDKKAQIKSLLDQTAGTSSSKFRESLEVEARELTKIGNNFQIRHSEKNQERLIKNEHVDYLFHRTFSLIQMIIRTNF